MLKLQICLIFTFVNVKNSYILWFNTQNHREYIKLTNEVEEIELKREIKEGMVYYFKFF